MDLRFENKKFDNNVGKRKRSTKEKPLLQKNPTNTMASLMKKDLQVEPQPQSKRRQTKSFFRPWLNSNESKNDAPITVSNSRCQAVTSTAKVLADHTIRQVNQQQQPSIQNHLQYHQRPNHLTAISLSHSIQQAQHLVRMQQQFAALHPQYHAIMEEQSLRALLYVKYLQQMALQGPQPMFGFGH